jgi:TatD DNase family protein
MLIDTHVHLDDPRYDQDREDILARAAQAGVSTFITIGCDLISSQAAVQLAGQTGNIFATVGVHPHEAREIQPDWYPQLRRLAEHPKVVAFGEIGLDFHYDHSPRDIQCRRFREQIQLAREIGLPLVIHTREANEQTLEILHEENAREIGGVFHCFSGDFRLAQEALHLGFYISFSGIITFRNAEPLREIARAIPDDRLLIETDAPYLTPVPFRGKRNESANVKLVAEQLAAIKFGDSPTGLERIAQLTSENAKRLFKISS